MADATGASASATSERPGTDASPSDRRATAAFLAILLLGLVVRLSGISTPITDIRETQSAMIARNIASDGLRGLWYPRVDYAGDQPGYLALEFPLVTGLGALLYRIFPAGGEAMFRVPSLAFYVLLMTACFDLLRRRMGSLPALFGAALLAAFPLHAELSASATQDEAGLALGISALALLDRHLSSSARSSALGAASMAAAAFLAKSTYLYVAIPMAVLVGSRRVVKGLLRPGCLLLAALSVAPLAGWMAHSSALNRSSELWLGRTAEDGSLAYLYQKGRFGFYASPAWYENVATRLAEGLTVAGALLAGLGIVLCFRFRKNRALVGGLLLGLVLYCVAVPLQVSTHHYYLLPAAPVAAAGGAAALLSISRWIRTGALRGLAAAALLLPVAAEGVPKALADLRSSDERKIAFGRAAQRIVPESALMIVTSNMIRSWDGSLTYVSARRGWKFSMETLDESNPDDVEKLRRHRQERGVAGQGRHAIPPAIASANSLTPELLETLRGKGAAFFAYEGSPVEWVKEKPELASAVLSKYPAVEVTPRWIFCDLRASFRESSFEPPAAGSAVSKDGFTLAGKTEVVESIRGARRRLLAWRVEEASGGSGTDGGGDAGERPFAGEIPARAFAPGTILIESKEAPGPITKRNP